MKRPPNLIYFLILMIVHSASSATALQSMTKKQVRKAFIKKTLISIPTDNLNGKTINNTFTMYMDGNGTIYGKMSLKPHNEPQTDKGIYSLENNGTVAITWDHWDRKEKLYAQFFETKNAYLAIGVDRVFHTVFMKENILNGNKINFSAQ